MGFNVNLYCVAPFVTQINWGWSGIAYLNDWFVNPSEVLQITTWLGQVWPRAEEKARGNFECLLHCEIKQ